MLSEEQRVTLRPDDARRVLDTTERILHLNQMESARDLHRRQGGNPVNKTPTELARKEGKNGSAYSSVFLILFSRIRILALLKGTNIKVNSHKRSLSL